jgi:hypothetical protein
VLSWRGWRNKLWGLAAALLLVLAWSAAAVELLEPEDIVARINGAPQGNFVTRPMTMEMTDRSGRTRSRETIGYRKNYEGERRSVLFYTAPANICDTAFLVYDYDDAREDDQWLYLPTITCSACWIPTWSATPCSIDGAALELLKLSHAVCARSE